MTGRESVREAQLRLALAPIATIAGLVAAIGASLQYWLGTGHFRPWALAMHVALMGVGLRWFSHPPKHPSRAAFLATCYLATLVGSFVLTTREISPIINLAMISIAASFAIPDRRYLVASQGVVFAWVVAALASPLESPSSVQLALGGFILAGATGATYFGRVRSMRADVVSTSDAIPRALVHDVNNLLGGIVGGADLALASADHPGDLEFALRQIRERALATRDYLRDAANPESRLEDASPNEIVERAIALARRDAGDRIKWVRDFAQGLEPIRVERRAIERAVFNLVLNAVDASQPGGGEIRIRTRMLEDEGRAFLSIRVEDDGPGIPVAERVHVFESGYTTRAGEHQGLGLAYVADVVARHQGVVCVDPGVGSGAAIEIRIPNPATTRTALEVAPPTSYRPKEDH